MLIIYTETSELCACSQITVMCVYCIWFGCEAASHCVSILYIHDTALCVNVCAGRFTVCVHLASRRRCWQSSHSYPLCPYMMSRTKILSLFDDTGPAASFYDVRKWRGGGHRVHWVRSKTSIQPTHTHEHAGLKERAGFLYLNWI